MLFWIIAALLILAALFFLLPPLLQLGTRQDTLDRDALNVTVFKDQLAELERDLECGVLTREQYATARHDLERSFIGDAGSTAPQPAATMGAQNDRIVGRATAAVILVLVPVLATSLYVLLGSGAAGLNPQQAQAEPQPPASPEEARQQLLDAVVQLQRKLQDDPGNLEDWIMLGRSHYFLEDYPKSAQAFEQAVHLTEEKDPELLADLADALAMSNQRNMVGRPFELVSKALAIQPQHEKSLWLAGVAAFQAQDQQSTLKYWEQLLVLLPPDSEEHRQMAININDIRQNLGLAVERPAGSPVQTGASISGNVKLAPELAARVAPGDTVFIFARSESGPRMPLAILRLQAGDLPAQFTLDDSMAMSAALNLSSAEQVIISARITRSGNAVAQSGDLEGSVGPLRVIGAAPVQVVIDRVVP